MQLKCNVGNFDRGLRILLGVPLSIYALSEMNIIAGIISFLLLSTAIIRSCTSYQLLGINTGCNRDNQALKYKKNILEGFAVSTSVYLTILIGYLTIKYIMLVINS